MKHVIVVPEKEAFERSTTYINEIYINKKLGIPNFKKYEAEYIAPFWLNEEKQGVRRVYHIWNHYDHEDCTIIELGNSFILKNNEIWNKVGNKRRFEYHRLSSFGLVEIKEGLLDLIH